MADSLQEFGDLFSDTKYKLYNSDSKIVGLTKPVGINLNNHEFISDTRYGVTTSYNVKNYTDISSTTQSGELSIIPHNAVAGSREAYDNFTFFSSGSNTELGLKYINDFLVNSSSIHEAGKYPSRKVLNNTIRFSEYEEPSLDDGDQAWLLDSEVNQN